MKELLPTDTHSTNHGLNHSMKNSRLLRPRIGSTGSTGQESPRSRSNLSSPLRTIRMDAASPGDDLSDDSGIRVDRGTYQHMFQDVINIKTMLLRLKRILQESETIPVENTLKNGLYYGLASSEAGEDTPQQLADLRRQVVLLQHQMEEKDRMILQLQEAVTRNNEARPQRPTGSSTSNAATQTDRIRPLSTGPTILQSSPESSSCSLVSNSSESLNHPLCCQITVNTKSRVPVGTFHRNIYSHQRAEQDSVKQPMHAFRSKSSQQK